MTEHVPPVPPADQPHANWPQPGQGSHPSRGPYGPVPGNEPPYGPPQPYTPPGLGQQAHHPQYAPYRPPQQYAPAPQQAKSSGYRVASGIVAIVLSLLELVFFANSAYMAAAWSAGAYIITAVVLAILGLGTLTTGIVLLAQHRRRNRITPLVLMALSASAILASAVLLVSELYGAPFLIVSVLLGVPILIVLGIGLSKEKRAPGVNASDAGFGL